MQGACDSGSTSGDCDSEFERPPKRMRQIQPYACDPSASSSDSEDDEPDEPPSPNVGRQPGPAIWCCCGDRCTDMPTAKERVCCREQKNVDSAAEEHECITLHPLFQLYCLNRHVLDLEYVKLQYYCPYNLRHRQEHE
ncbi:uncharacterized protein LOC119400853 [Rhipicephalus sanguineus]|uniref:uncharacterized protein LOC119400853 n=1 Tax=Rhipicephalus sanguineus TaxID=34632 RepID=UPI0020C1FA0C|nr:uncharacterized protein LOC119400853 [Rhipicephalus sanguineus]